MSKKRKAQNLSKALGTARHPKKRMRERYPGLDIKKLRAAIRCGDFDEVGRAPGRAFECQAMIDGRPVRFLLKNPKVLVTVLPSGGSNVSQT